MKMTRSEIFGSIGWLIFIGSVYSFLMMKGSGSPYTVLFFACLATLILVSIGYLVAWCVSPRCRSKAIWSYFSLYVIGAIGWVLLILLLFTVGWVSEAFYRLAPP
jgi:hypothetical protein